MAVDHVEIYVKIGIECPEGETKVPDSERIAIGNRIYDQLKDQTTSYLRVDVVSSTMDGLVDVVLCRMANELDRGVLNYAQALMSHIPRTLLLGYLNNEK